MSWAGLGGDGVRSWASDVEGRRFGLSVSRVVVGTGAVEGDDLRAQFADALAEARSDLVIARWPSELSSLAAVAADSGRRVIPADVLTYWEVPSAHLAASAGDLPDGFHIELPTEASPAAESAVATVVEDSFRGYGNHYTSNPALDPELALAGYLEWAIGAFRADPGNVVLLMEGDDPIGVATLTASGDDLEIELAGLTGAAQGKGLYGYLLAAVGRAAVNRGAARTIISTQVHNIRVQRAWVRAGMKPFAAITTTHLPR